MEGAAVAAVIAAVIAGVFAVMSARTTATNGRIVELEKRLATHRAEMYKPMIDAMAAIMVAGTATPRDEENRRDGFMEAAKTFATWVQVYGSDDSVRTYHRMMQAGYVSAPPAVMLRAYGEFILAARRDLADPHTNVAIGDLLGIRINDYYERLAADMSLSEDAFYRKVGWVPPWSDKRGE